MNELLAEVIDAHGGLDRWNSLNLAEATLVTGGGLWGLKGLVQDPNPRRMTVSLHEQRASVDHSVTLTGIRSTRQSGSPSSEATARL